MHWIIFTIFRESLSCLDKDALLCLGKFQIELRVRITWLFNIKSMDGFHKSSIAIILSRSTLAEIKIPIPKFAPQDHLITGQNVIKRKVIHPFILTWCTPTDICSFSVRESLQWSQHAFINVFEKGLGLCGRMRQSSLGFTQNVSFASMMSKRFRRITNVDYLIHNNFVFHKHNSIVTVTPLKVLCRLLPFLLQHSPLPSSSGVCSFEGIGSDNIPHRHDLNPLPRAVTSAESPPSPWSVVDDLF